MNLLIHFQHTRRILMFSFSIIFYILLSNFLFCFCSNLALLPKLVLLEPSEIATVTALPDLFACPNIFPGTSGSSHSPKTWTKDKQLLTTMDERVLPDVYWLELCCLALLFPAELTFYSKYLWLPSFAPAPFHHRDSLKNSGAHIWLTSDLGQEQTVPVLSLPGQPGVLTLSWHIIHVCVGTSVCRNTL